MWNNKYDYYNHIQLIIQHVQQFDRAYNYNLQISSIDYVFSASIFTKQVIVRRTRASDQIALRHIFITI